MVIPREGNMVRLYIQIASSTDKDWNPRKTATEEEVQNSAKRIFQPYNIEWERVEWFSVYPIGQGIAEKYTLNHRVFMGGDACHTHSVSACKWQTPNFCILNQDVAESGSRYEYRISRCLEFGMETSLC